MFGKSRVIPVGSEAAEDSAHHNSIPRFELTAGAAAAEFYNKYRQEVQNDPKEIYFWTDSECFLKQLRNRSGRHATFVRNRLSKIRSWTDLKGWHYVDTKNNPADIASRGLKAGDKEGWNIYHHGPHFLRDPQWVPPEAPEEVWVAAVAEQEPPKGPETAPAFILEVAARKDRWADKVRLIARLKRCANKWLKKGPLEQRDPRAALSAQELEEARWDIWRELQKTHFPKEVNFLREKGIRTAEARTTARLPKSQLRKLNPFLDQHGLIRSSTRLLNAQGLTYNEKCPIVLPKRHDTVDALIRECHIRHAHMGVEFVIKHPQEGVPDNGGQASSPPSDRTVCQVPKAVQATHHSANGTLAKRPSGGRGPVRGDRGRLVWALRIAMWPPSSGKKVGRDLHVPKSQSCPLRNSGNNLCPFPPERDNPLQIPLPRGAKALE